jgi:iron(III) transport system ATP-binding protein
VSASGKISSVATAAGGGAAVRHGERGTAIPAAIGVRIDGLSKRFTHRVKGEVFAARDVSLDVAPGEFVTLLGPSGCGKTTTLRMIAGFEMPDAGRIAFGGQDVTLQPANERGIGFVFQNYALFPHLSVFENVAYGLRVRGAAIDAIARDVAAVLAQVGLAGYEPQFPAQLSGGEQQRVALARAIVIRPRVLLFDEPLSNLDARLRVQMRNEIRDLQRRLAISAIYVTHDQEEAMAVSDRIAVMQAGRIVQVGTAEDLYHRPASRFVAQFIGRANLVEARVEEVAADRIGVAALGRRLAVRSANGRLSRGQTVHLLLRPEAIAVSDAMADGIEANVVSRTFLGEKTDYVVRCAGALLQVASYAVGPHAFEPGARVSISVDERTAIVLAGDDDGGKR